MIEPLQSIAYFITNQAQRAGVEPGTVWRTIYLVVSLTLIAAFWSYHRKYR